ncbi:MAG: hypothetical protein QOJ85_3284 [Solirubrobacteraceae bacterium]|jgi:uncharacterized protein (DUF305 family)|nr:hypothetical protein [Solirubrobacteraceae bacterium]
MTRLYLPILAAVAALLIAGCGDDAASTAAGNATDRAFVAEMVPHHESAVRMAEIAKRRSSSTFVTRLAGDIERTQTQEITTMRARDRVHAAAGVKPGSLGMSEHMMGMDGDMMGLSSAKPFDAAFLQMMIPHHKGAIGMATYELDHGRDPQLKTLARTMIAAQQREIRAMRQHLTGTEMHGSGHAG